jgi:hypothetical protein
VVLAFASACGLAPASADIITVNVTVTTTHDPAGLFGSLGSDISVVYTFDTSLGIFSGNDIYSEVHGGTVYGLTPLIQIGRLRRCPKGRTVKSSESRPHSSA